MISTKKITFIALFAALSFVLSNLIFIRMPQGGSVTLYLFPLIIAAFNADLKTNLFIGIVVATLNVLIGGYFLNPLQVILDYYLPVIIICCSGIFNLNKYINLIIAFIIALFSYVLSGMIFFNVPFQGAITYNATFFIPTIIINMIVVLLVNNRLAPIISEYLKRA